MKKHYMYYNGYKGQRKPIGKLFLFLLSFFIAVILGRVFLWGGAAQFDRWNLESIHRMNQQKLDEDKLFFYLCLHRGELLLFLILGGVTRWRKVLYYIASALAGSCLGVLCISFCHTFGVKGILVLLLSLVPQWFIYGMLFVYLYWLFVVKEKKPDRLQLTLFCVGILLLFFVGVYLECFVNPILLRLCAYLKL